MTDFQFEKILESSKKYENQKKLKLKQFEPVAEDDETESIIVRHHKTPFMLNPKLSFIKQSQHAKSYKLSGYFAEIRDERYRNRENRDY